MARPVLHRVPCIFFVHCVFLLFFSSILITKTKNQIWEEQEMTKEEFVKIATRGATRTKKWSDDKPWLIENLKKLEVVDSYE